MVKTETKNSFYHIDIEIIIMSQFKKSRILCLFESLHNWNWAERHFSRNYTFGISLDTHISLTQSDLIMLFIK